MSDSLTERLYLRVESELKDAIREEVSRRPPEVKEAHIVREVLRDALLGKSKPKTRRKRRAKKKADTGPSVSEIVDAVYQIWDDEMPDHIKRPTVRNDTRDIRIMQKYQEVPDLELWRYGIKAVSLDPWSMGRDPRNRNWTANFDWFISPGTRKDVPPFIKWIEAGKELKAHGVPTSKHGPSQEFLEMMEGIGDAGE